MKTKFYPAMIIALLVNTKDVNAQANQNLSNLVSPVAVNKNLSPFVNNGVDIGTSTKAWRDIYLGNALYLKSKLMLHQVGATNFFVGPLAGRTDAKGSYNLGLGFSALSSVEVGSENTAIGYNALKLAYSEYASSAFGYEALSSSHGGTANTAIGAYSLKSNIYGFLNTAVGAWALLSNTDGYENTANGFQALYKNTEGSHNTAGGVYTLSGNTTGYSNTAYGAYAMKDNQSGFSNTAIGHYASSFSNTGSYNTVSGANSLMYNPEGNYNTASGANSLMYNPEGNYNTATGYAAGGNFDNGSMNTFIGALAAANQGSLENSTAIGFDARTTANNQIRIGNSDITSIGGYVNWTNISDGRYKKNVKENVSGLDFINKLKPVTYNLDISGIHARFAANRPGKEVSSHGRISKLLGKEKMELAERKLSTEERKAIAEKEKVLYSGFVAQDVEKAAKETGYEFSGVDAPENDNDLYGLRYAEFVVPLVKAVQELSQQVDKLSKQNEALQQEVAALKSGRNTDLSAGLPGASLEQNTPNPSKGSTVISYSLPQRFTKAQLVVLDAAGKSIKQINLATQQGRGMITLNTASLASGAYSYSLMVDGKLVATKKMILQQ